MALYAVAMSFHFLGVGYSLEEEYGVEYHNKVRYILAAASIMGWLSGILIEFPKPMIITLLGFVSGAVIMNSTLGELPRREEGKFGFFLAGGILYALILMLAAGK
ncbi:MAG: hypothetical protein K8T10_20520 [Candidatus Eremiobacteraeota bacterium]|nr:hypothetical protein [Candidatus Eremiobacteraeota bacterium]